MSASIHGFNEDISPSEHMAVIKVSKAWERFAVLIPANRQSSRIPILHLNLDFRRAEQFQLHTFFTCGIIGKFSFEGNVVTVDTATGLGRSLTGYYKDPRTNVDIRKET